MFAVRTRYIVPHHSKNQWMNIIGDDPGENRKGWQVREAVSLILEIEVVLFSRWLLHLPIMRSQEHLLMNSWTPGKSISNFQEAIRHPWTQESMAQEMQSWHQPSETWTFDWILSVLTLSPIIMSWIWKDKHASLSITGFVTSRITLQSCPQK